MRLLRLTLRKLTCVVLSIFSFSLLLTAFPSCSAGRTPNIKVQFVSSRVGWIVGARLWHTNDGGLTWNVVRSNGFGTFEAEYVGYGHRGIQFIDSGVGVQLGGNTLAKTSDGGLTWTEQLPIPKPDNQDIPPQTVFFISREVGWIVGELVYGTNDGGRNWQQLCSTPTGDAQEQRNMRMAPTYANYMPSLWFTDSKNGVMARLDGEVYATRDGGRAWEVVLRAQRSIKDIFFVDAQAGWMVGAGGFIARTSDGGRTWTILQTSTKADLNSISFASERVGGAVGEDGTILFTRDSGTTWNIASVAGLTKPGPPLASVSFTDELHGFAVGGNSDPMKPSLYAPSSVVLATDDGGQSWRIVKL